MIVEAVVTVIVPVSLYLAYRAGLHRGREEGVRVHFSNKNRHELMRRRLEALETGSSPVVRRAIVKPTSRTRSQVDLEDEIG